MINFPAIPLGQRIVVKPKSFEVPVCVCRRRYGCFELLPSEIVEFEALETNLHPGSCPSCGQVVIFRGDWVKCLCIGRELKRFPITWIEELGKEPV